MKANESGSRSPTLQSAGPARDGLDAPPSLKRQGSVNTGEAVPFPFCSSAANAAFSPTPTLSLRAWASLTRAHVDVVRKAHTVFARVQANPRASSFITEEQGAVQAIGKRAQEGSGSKPYLDKLIEVRCSICHISVADVEPVNIGSANSVLS